MKLLHATYQSYATCHLGIDVLIRRCNADSINIFININSRSDFERYSSYNVPFWSGVLALNSSAEACKNCSSFIESLKESEVFGDNAVAEVLAIGSIELFLNLFCNLFYDCDNAEDIDNLLNTYSKFLV